MDAIECMHARRSIRAYSPGPSVAIIQGYAAEQPTGSPRPRPAVHWAR
jgi:hypothetical protein